MPDLLNQPLCDSDNEENHQPETTNKSANNKKNNQQEIIDESPNNGNQTGSKDKFSANNDINLEVELTGSIQEHKQGELKAYWQNAMQQANIVARTSNQGKLPAGMERQFKELQSAQIDWRTYLGRYLVQTPTDFHGFDRRFISHGLYFRYFSRGISASICVH